MYRSLFIVPLLLAFTFRAQVFRPSAETAFEAQHNFNPEQIRIKGIKKIILEIIDKKDFEVAVDQNLTEIYEFNDAGKPSRFYYTNIVRTNERQVTRLNHKGQKHSFTTNEYVYDTISTNYFYDGDHLILKRYHDGLHYYEARYYRYDSLGNLTKELRFKETNNSPDRSLFILGNQVLLSEDSFQYRKFSSGQQKCVFLNNEHRPYKERITNYDSLGRKTSEYEQYTAASWIRQESSFEYQGDRLVTARFEGNASHSIQLKNTYEYDEMNELYSEKHFKNDVLIREISYVTDKAERLLHSIIIRDPVRKTIRIVRLRYDFGRFGKNK